MSAVSNVTAIRAENSTTTATDLNDSGKIVTIQNGRWSEGTMRPSKYRRVNSIYWQKLVCEHSAVTSLTR